MGLYRVRAPIAGGVGGKALGPQSAAHTLIRGDLIVGIALAAQVDGVIIQAQKSKNAC